MSDLLIAFDLETTGLDHSADRIVTAAVVGDPRFDMHLLINPGIPIPREASAVHGITDSMVAGGTEYRQGLQMIGDMLMQAWAMGAVVVGHNIDRYDLPMLHAQESVHFGQRRTTIGPIFDTCSEYRKMYPGKSAKLSSVCEHAGVSLHNAHNAAADAHASLAVARLLIEAKKARG